MVWQNFSIRKKLIVIIMTSCAMALVLSTVAFMSYDINTFKSQMLLELKTLAYIIGKNSSATIVFKDQESAKEILSAFKAKPHITAAATLIDGVPLASYQRDKGPMSAVALQSEGHRFTSNRLQIMQDVIFKGNKIGDVYIESDLEEIHLRLNHYLVAFFIITVLIFGLIFFLASRMQRSISGPILELTKMTEAVSKSQDYGVEIHKHNNDEIGQLFDEFNQMMRKIQIRDNRLRAMYEAQKEFTSTVSHELRTPLASIKMAVDLIAQEIVGSINSEQKDILSRAKQETDRLKRLIDDILDLTKIESGKMKMNFKPNDVHGVISQVVETQRDIAQNRGLYIKTDFDPQVTKAYFDYDRIVQVLNNLVSNALKFTKQGGITIKTHNEPEENHVLISVVDTGKGIQSDYFSKLFQKFNQIPSGEKNEEGGTGLGLAICKEIIQYNGGKIWVESKVGEGSIFYFTLPIQERRIAL